MLTPEQIAALRDRAGQITDPINDFLLEDIARRIAEAGQFTSTASYQVWRMQQMGLSQSEIKKRLKKLLKKSSEEVEQLLTQSAEVGYRYDLKRLPTAAGIPFEQNSTIQQIVSATVELALEDFTNLTQTIGMVDPHGNALPLQDLYRSCTDYAFKQVITGAADYNTAVRRATKNLVEKGVRVIEYESGVHTSVEAAVRRNIMGGLGLMQEQINAVTHEDFGCDGWEISAHANSAPDHEPIQGKQYTDAAYESLNNSLVRRIGTLNCGHAAFPIIMGVTPPQYTKEELEKFREDNEKGVTYDGKHYTGYEATQLQRKLERAIRKQKKRILVDEATGDEEKLLIDRIKLQRLRQEYTRFSKAAGLRTQNERAQVVGFGKETAARASTPAKKQIALIDSFTNSMAKAGYSVKGFDYYTGDAETLNQMQTAFTRMAKEFPAEANGLTIRLAQVKDNSVIGWFDNKTKTIGYNRDLVKIWPVLQKDYAERVKAGHFPVGTDARSCFYHEFGHAVGYARGINYKKVTTETMVAIGRGFGNPPHMTAKAAVDLLPSLLSGYSASWLNKPFEEVLAESFSEWYNSAQPREFCEEFLRKAGVL